MINNRLAFINMIISSLIVGFLAKFPACDIFFSKIFFSDSIGFAYKNNLVVRFFYLLVPLLSKFSFFLCAFGLLYHLVLYKKNITDCKLKIHDVALIYIVLTLLIGPGLAVNSVLKQYTGRARPAQTIEFNGEKQFTPVLTFSRQCKSNCSFASGHAAMAFAFTNIAYAVALLNRKKSTKKHFTIIYIVAMLLGIAVGLSRIIAGGHFLSDVAASCFIVCLINHIFYLCCIKILRQKKLY